MSENARRSVRGPVVLLVALAVLLTVTVGAVVLPYVMRAEAEELEVYGEVPAFVLEDHTGTEITEDNLRGHVTIADFVFTRCETICPTITMKMKRVQDRTGDLERLKLISFSVDPEHDTPEILADYAEQFGADARRWRFVTGEQDVVWNTVRVGMMQSMDPDGTMQPGGAPNIRHSEHFVLIDGDLQIRGFYDSNDAPRIEKLLQHARQLVKSL